MKQFIQLTGFKILITAGLLIIGGLLVINQQMNIGQFVAAEIIILSIIAAVEKLFSGLELLYDVLTSLEKIGTVVDMELEENVKNTHYQVTEKELKIEMQNVSFQYPKSEKLLIEQINLTIQPKQHTLIIGENAAGKTTLIRLLARIIEPTSGAIYINDINYTKFTSDEYRSKIGIITNNELPFEGTILENITCNNPNIKMETVFDLIQKLKLHEAIKALPKGLETQISSEGKQINTSTIQKIILARCIINQPKFLFLENPLDKIDGASCKEILNYLAEPQHPWTLIATSKNSYFKEICNQIIELKQGTIITN
jgi:ABC-type bacteriocin/lantibiotic exporter with double-glycine peptidase domain